MTAHASHAMHAHSLEAYASLDLSKREALVLSAFLAANCPLSDKEAAARLGFDHRSRVQPRISDLVRKGLLCEIAAAKDPQTGISVRVCMPTAKARRT